MTTRTLFPTTLALGIALLTLTPSAGATPASCALDKFKIRYYASEVDAYHYKRVVAYCHPEERPIACDAQIFSSPDASNDYYNYLVALNEAHPWKNTDHASAYYQREGCWARANTLYRYPIMLRTEASRTVLTEEMAAYELVWGLRVYATCVPKHCVQKSAGQGEYTWDEPAPLEEVPVE